MMIARVANYVLMIDGDTIEHLRVPEADLGLLASMPEEADPDHLAIWYRACRDTALTNCPEDSGTQTVRHTAERFGSFEGWCESLGDGLVCTVLPQPQLGFDIIYLYDHRPAGRLPKERWTEAERQAYEEDGEEPYRIGGNFGYALNSRFDDFSEWGYAPFAQAGETDEQHFERWASSMESLSEVFGGGTAIDATQPGAPSMPLADFIEQARKQFHESRR